VILASFGDMLRVPGSGEDLLTARSRGADVRIVYSPTDALALAERNPERQVVFFAVGFETTAPANAMAVWIAAKKGLDNFSVRNTRNWPASTGYPSSSRASSRSICFRGC
jgi:hydrogenase expression/formation protein HypD